MLVHPRAPLVREQVLIVKAVLQVPSAAWLQTLAHACLDIWRRGLLSARHALTPAHRVVVLLPSVQAAL
jgi:hypothetical protein